MNEQIFYFFYNFTHQSALIDTLTIFTAKYLPYLTIIFAGFFLLWHHRILHSVNPIQEFFIKWREIFFTFFSSGLAFLSAKILKVLFHIPRPFLALSDVQPLFNKTTYSFPSEHAAIFGALALAIFFVNKKIGYVFIFLALLIGVARIIAGVHFPVDIFWGLVLGMGIAYFLKRL